MTRRQALAASSPPLLALLGALAGFGLVCLGSVAWNVVDICRRREEWADKAAGFNLQI